MGTMKLWNIPHGAEHPNPTARRTEGSNVWQILQVFKEPLS